MRKVTKKNEIPIKMIEPDSIKRRLNRFAGKKVGIASEKRMSKLMIWLADNENNKVQSKALMSRIYSVIDKYMEKEIADFLVCSKGCAYCCKVPVQVSLLEANYIEERTKIKFNRKTKNQYQIAKRVDTYCPFLDQITATCKIYKYRPMGCRLFGTFDSWKECINSENSHYIHCFSGQPVFEHLHEFLMLHSKAVGENYNIAAVAEIRDWYPEVK